MEKWRFLVTQHERLDPTMPESGATQDFRRVNLPTSLPYVASLPAMSAVRWVDRILINSASLLSLL